MDETLNYDPDQAFDAGQRGSEALRAAANEGRYVFTSGARPLDGYTIKRAIGRGGFGEVYYAVTDAGKEVALKLITRNLEVERRGVIQCMNLKSPHLIAIHDLRTNDEGDTFVIMEYVSGPNLASILERYPAGMPEAEVRHWLKGLVDGVAYLHDHGIVHRDLKPANLFLEENVVKIGDYGLSKAITSGKEPGHSQSVGTCHYMAPEIGTGKYHRPIDVYAIGVILYELVTGRVPFDGESVHEVLMKHLTARPDLSVLPEPYRGIVTRALAKDPNLRPQRVQDLLLPGDARPEPSVRFIAEDHAAAGGDVHRIGADDPVLYIGPDTVPGRPRQAAGAAGLIRTAARPIRRLVEEGATTATNRLRAAAAAAIRPNPAPAPASPRPRPAAAPNSPPPPPTTAGVQPLLGRPAAPRSAPAPQVPPPARGRRRFAGLLAAAPAPPAPQAPVLPSGRLRVAELATSMLMAAPLAAFGTLLSVPLFEAFDGQQPRDVGQFGLLFSALLLGTWGVLAPPRLWEGRPLSRAQKRLVLGSVGVGLGVVIMALAAFTQASFPPGGDGNSPLDVLQAARAGSPPFAPLAGFFGLALGLGGFWNLAERDRRARFRFAPILWAGLLALILNSALPTPRPWAGIVVILIALLAQLASPWSRQAAAYARYREAAGPRRRAA